MIFCILFKFCILLRGFEKEMYQVVFSFSFDVKLYMLLFFPPDVNHLMILCFNAACRVFQDTLKPSLTVTSQSTRNSFFVRLQRQESSISLAQVWRWVNTVFMFIIQPFWLYFLLNVLATLLQTGVFCILTLVWLNLTKEVFFLLAIDWLVELIYKTQMFWSSSDGVCKLPW